MNLPRLVGLLAVILPAAAGCYREAIEATAARPRPASTDLWNIDGVRPGQEFAEVKHLFGEPREIRGATGPRTATWERRNTAVTFGADGRVTEVMGATVQAGDRILVSAGATQAEVVQLLGPGEVRTSHRPGSGVIAFGGEHTGTPLIYGNAGVRFELPVFGETAGRFLARRKP